MGPILIFDKSFLESLNPDEAVWLDHFFRSNITPLFYIETLADLEKQVRAGRTPEEIVGNIAYKTPDLHSRPNVHHRTLLAGELTGQGAVEMGIGRPLIAGGRQTALAGQAGIVFEQSPEEEAFSRWQKHEFLDLERQQARAWREDLVHIDLDRAGRPFEQLLTGRPRPKTLQEAKMLADSIIDGNRREDVFRIGLILIGCSEEAIQSVLQRWQGAGRPPISAFAPYFRHVYGVDLCFHLALAADVVSRRRTNKVDLAYLYYLPFCMIFTSNDKFHSAMVPLFLRRDQTFVIGGDLKADLALLDRHYDAKPEADKGRGLYELAPHPPASDSFLTTQLWDKHLPKWRSLIGFRWNRTPEADARIVELTNKQADAPDAPVSAQPISSDDADYVLIKRYVSPRKGKWKRLPPEVAEVPPESSTAGDQP